MKPEDEPTTAHILASVAGIALTARKMIEGLDAGDPQRVRETLDALHEHLAVSGGSAVFLADRLGCAGEVQRLIDEGQARLAAFRASQGLGGRA